MQWDEVRVKYPNQFVKIKILEAKVNGNKQIINKISFLNPVDKNEATKELLNSKNNVIVYHTSHDVIEIGIRKRSLFNNFQNKSTKF